MSNPKQENVEIKFRLSNIELLKSEFSIPAQEREIYNFSIKIQNTVNTETRTIDATIFSIIHGGKIEEKFAEFITKLSFQLEDIDPVIKKNENQEIKIDTRFLTTINSISISTTRGIVFSSLKGTALDKAFLPIFDPKKFFEDDKKAIVD